MNYRKKIHNPLLITMVSALMIGGITSITYASEVATDVVAQQRAIEEAIRARAKAEEKKASERIPTPTPAKQPPAKLPPPARPPAKATTPPEPTERSRRLAAERKAREDEELQKILADSEREEKERLEKIEKKLQEDIKRAAAASETEPEEKIRRESRLYVAFADKTGINRTGMLRTTCPTTPPITIEYGLINVAAQGSNLCGYEVARNSNIKYGCIQENIPEATCASMLKATINPDLLSEFKKIITTQRLRWSKTAKEIKDAHAAEFLDKQEIKLLEQKFNRSPMNYTILDAATTIKSALAIPSHEIYLLSIALKQLRLASHASHIFILGNMNNTDPTKKGHWVAVVAEKKDGKIILYVMNSLKYAPADTMANILIDLICHYSAVPFLPESAKDLPLKERAISEIRAVITRRHGAIDNNIREALSELTPIVTALQHGRALDGEDINPILDLLATITTSSASDGLKRQAQELIKEASEIKITPSRPTAAIPKPVSAVTSAPVAQTRAVEPREIKAPRIKVPPLHEYEKPPRLLSDPDWSVYHVAVATYIKQAFDGNTQNNIQHALHIVDTIKNKDMNLNAQNTAGDNLKMLAQDAYYKQKPLQSPEHWNDLIQALTPLRQ